MFWKIAVFFGTCVSGNLNLNYWWHLLQVQYVTYTSYRTTQSCNGIANATEDWC
jgi:hypothetical protein